MMSISEAGRASPVLKPLPVVDEDKSASVSRDRRGAEYRPRRHEERRDREHDGERDKYYRERERERAKERSSENGEEKRRRSHNDVDRDKRYSHRHRSHRHDSRASLDEMSREAERDREKHDNGKWEMSRRERNRDRNRDGGGEKERKRERDRDQERERDEVDRDRDRDRDKDRDRERKRERNRERDRGRDRNGERRRGRDTDQVTSGEHGRDATDKERHQNSGEDRGVNQVHERGVEGERQDAGIDVEQVREDESSEGKGKGKKRDIEKQNNDEGKKTEHQPIMEHDHQRKKERERERHRERRRDGDGVGRYGGERYNDKYYDDKYGRTSRSFPEDYQKAERYQTHKRSYSHSGYSHGYYDRYRPREYDRYERYTNRDYRNDDRQQEGDKYERRRYHDKTRYEYEKYRNKGEQQTPHRTGDHEPSHTRRRSSEESIRMIPPPGWRAQQRQISEYRVRPDKPLPPASASQPQHVIPIFAGPPAPPTVIDYPTSVHRASMVVLPPTAPISHRTAADIGKTAGPGADIMPGMHWNPEVLRTRGQAAKAQGPRGEIAKQLINTEPAIVWNQASLAADAREQQKKSRFRRPPWLPTPKGHAGSRLLEVFSPQTATVQKQSLPLVRG
ncbi:hypothetical protein AX15_005619 [Amanita polypyramis BW_CC]|nr:hypothetical protein AX15_005619 [Amanita polypyramis BW_CC]